MAKSRGRATIKIEVKDVDRGWSRFRKITEQFKGNGKSYVKVGYLDDGGKGSQAHSAGGISTAELAAVHEFGTRDGHIPARPHVGPTFEQNRDKYTDDLKTLVKGIYDGKMTVERALGLMGAKMSSDIKKYVTTGAGVPPPNAESTVVAKLIKGAWKQKKVKQKKGEEGPAISVGTANVRTLIDTARMVGALTWSVVMQGKKEGGGS